jgi:putative ABC transport system substrate-binding protein
VRRRQFVFAVATFNLLTGCAVLPILGTASLPGVARGIHVDVIVSGASQAIQAAKAASQNIPIVMVNVGDPVGDGLVVSLAHPGGNVTGMSTYQPQLAAKRVELLLQFAPHIRRLAIMNAAASPSAVLVTAQARQAAESLGLETLILDVRTDVEYDRAFESAKNWKADALIPPSQLIGGFDTIPKLATQSRLPAIYNASDYVDAGGLIAYGPSLPAVFRRAADYVDRVLRGANPADLPVQQPTSFDLVVNGSAPTDLGLTVPPSVLPLVTRWVS